MKTIYGVHSVTLLDVNTHKPKSVLYALASANLELTGEFEKLTGGSALFPFDSEVKSMASELSFAAREYPSEAMEALLAGKITEYASNVSGQIVEKQNLVGDSGDDVTVALKSGSSGDLKAGRYVFIFTGTDKGILYATSNIGGGTFEDEDALQITAELTLTSSAQEVSGYGITLAGPAVPAFVSGDAFEFTVFEAGRDGEVIKVGSITSTFQEFAAVIHAQKRGSGKYIWIFIHKIKVCGMPLSFEEKKFSEWNVKMDILYDPEKDGAFDFWRQGF